MERLNNPHFTRQKPEFILSNRFLLATIALMALYTSILFGQTKYIDPTNSGDPQQNGSIEHPYDSWSKISWTDGTTYLQKRNTTANESQISIGAHNVTMGAYGSGSRPKIACTSSGGGAYAILIQQKRNFTIDNFEITAPNAKSCIYAKWITGNNTTTVSNCHIHHTMFGLRVAGVDNFHILNTEISDIEFDGLYSEVLKGFEMGNCHIHHVNTAYFPGSTEYDAGGDGIQLENGCDDFYIHDNIIDRSNSGWKFCIIIGSDGDDSGIIENNTLIGSDLDIVSGVYLKYPFTGVVLRNNHFINTMVGINVSHVSNGIDVYYNTFEESVYGLRFEKQGNTLNRFVNNTVVNFKHGITAFNSDCKIKNNIFYSQVEASKAIRTDMAGIESDYNLFFPIKPGFINGLNSLSAWQNASGMDANSMAVNPNFVNLASFDLHLTQNSPAIDNGIELGFTQDNEGNAVPQGGAPDLGAYEATAQAINHAPTISPFNKLGTENIQLDFELSDFTSHYSDPDNDPLHDIKIISLPENGTLRLNTSVVGVNQVILETSINQLCFVPEANFSGTTSFNWNACDGALYANQNVSVEIQIEENNINQSPLVSSFDKLGTENTNIDFVVQDFSSNFSDPDGDSLKEIKIISLPDEGSLQLGNTAVSVNQIIASNLINNLTYIPDENFIGNTTFRWNASDGVDYSAQPANVNIEMVAGNTGNGEPHFIEDFEVGVPTNYYSGTLDLSTGTYNTNYITRGNAGKDDDYSLRIIMKKYGANLTTPAVNTAGQIKFWYRGWLASSSGTFSIEKSVNNGPFTAIATHQYSGNAWQEYMLEVNDDHNNIRFRIAANYQPASLYIDHLSVTSMDVTPVLSNDATLADLKVNSSSIPGFSPEITSYEVEIQNQDPLPVISAETSHPNSTSTINQAPSVPGSATVSVLAEDGITSKTYQVVFTQQSVAGSTGVFEDFENNMPTSAFTGSLELPSGVWEGNYIIRGNAGKDSDYSLRIMAKKYHAHATTPPVDKPAKLSFWVRSWIASGSGEFEVQKSVDDGAFVTIATETFSGNVFSKIEIPVYENSANVRFRFYHSYQDFSLYIDQLEISTLDTSQPAISGEDKKSEPIISLEPEINVWVANRQLHIQSEQSDLTNLQIKIYDLQGRGVLDMNNTNGTTSYIPSKIPNGIYIIRIAAGNYIKSEKIHIQ